jgi:hypothetical protein
MKHVLLAATALFSAVLPASAFAGAPQQGPATVKQSICIPVVVETPEGPVEGVFCYAQGGRV